MGTKETIEAVMAGLKPLEIEIEDGFFEGCMFYHEAVTVWAEESIITILEAFAEETGKSNFCYRCGADKEVHRKGKLRCMVYGKEYNQHKWRVGLSQSIINELKGDE